MPVSACTRFTLDIYSLTHEVSLSHAEAITLSTSLQEVKCQCYIEYLGLVHVLQHCLCQQHVLAQAWPETSQEPRKCHCAWVGGTLYLSQHWNSCALNTSEGVVLWIQSWHPDHLQSWRVSGGRLFSCSLQIYTSVPVKFWPAGQHFLHGPSCHNVGCTRCSWCLSSGALILCPATLSYPGQVWNQVCRTMTPNPLPAAQIFVTFLLQWG